MAWKMPADGKMISLEIDEGHAAVAQRNLARAGVTDQVEVRLGPAAVTLAAMRAAGEAPFDLVFIDADKEGYPGYLEQTVPMTRDGGLVLADRAFSRPAPDSP